MNKRFRSPTNTPLSVALTSGHTTVIPPEGVDLPSIFHRHPFQGVWKETIVVS